MKINKKIRIHFCAILTVLTFITPKIVFASNFDDQIVKIKNGDEVTFIKNGEEITLKISKNDFNQIKVINDDKIKSIKNDADKLKVLPIDKSLENGIYIHFLKDELATLTITTKKDITYKLLLIPVSIPSTDITIQQSFLPPISQSKIDQFTKFCIIIVIIATPIYYIRKNIRRIKKPLN
jgi:hypothetical protein